MGHERAETYLRLLAESEARRAARHPGSASPADIAERVEYVRWAGYVLVTAGVLEEEDVRRVSGELQVNLLARSGLERSRHAARMNWIYASLADPAPVLGAVTAQPMGSTPIGRTIRVADERAPSDLHLMALVRSPDGVAIAAAMRMHWPPDGSSADLEITGAGPQHLPYRELWVVDDLGIRHQVDLSGEAGALTWQGAIGLRGIPGPEARWLDLVADGTHRLVRIDLPATDIRSVPATEPDPAAPAGPTVFAGPAAPAGLAGLAAPAVLAEPEAPAGLPGERILAEAADRILVSAWDSRGPQAPPRLGATITVLSGAGALAADSATPGQLAALCLRLGLAGHGITAPAAAGIPARWAKVLEWGEPPGAGPEWFAPLGPAAVDLEDTRFAFAGLTTAGGQSFLHMLATGLAPLLANRWDTGFSWWVRDAAGRWHVAVETDPQARAALAGGLGGVVPPGQQSLAGGSGAVALRLRLTPPLDARPDAIEVEVTGRRSRVRAVVPVGPDMSET